MVIKQLLIIVFIFITVIISYYLRMLSRSGAFAAILIGFFITIGFGVEGLVILGCFFVTSSSLSKFKAERKVQVVELLEKDDHRDWQQVFANGAVAAIISLLFYFYNTPLLLVAYLISIASNTADTWASEVGVLSKSKPISIKNFQRVSHGTSGAVSIIGTVMALIGASTIAIIGKLLFEEINIFSFFIIIIFGFIGNVVDTVFGAFAQVSYKCRQCGLITEKLLHCNKPTELFSGRKIINNEAVNFLSSLIATVFGTFIYYFLFHK